MIEISFGKLILLALVALIVLGPEKLPGAARTAGALLRRLRSGWDNVRAEVERELEIEEIRRAAREAAAHAEAAQAELDSALRQVRDPLALAAAKTSEPFRLMDAAPTGEDSPSKENPSLPDASAASDHKGAQPEQGSDLPIPARSSDHSLGEERAARGEPDITRANSHMTGQLFGDAPMTTEPADAATRKAAHGGH